MKKIHILIAVASCCAFLACSKDEPSDRSIFPLTPPDRNPFEEWIHTNYEVAYNMDLIYRWDDGEADYAYNLTPPKEEKSREMAMITRHLFMGSYDEITGSSDFMRRYVPKILMFVGGPALDPGSGTMTMGQAEGGIKMTMFYVNALDITDIEMLNENFFRTLHHEFAHILDQNIQFNRQQFNAISAGDYFGDAWYTFGDKESWDAGFISNYGGSQPMEDFVEVFANYITRPEGYVDNILNSASELGRDRILQKIEFVKDWTMKSYNIDLDQLRKIIQRRQSEMPDLQMPPSIF